MMKCLVARKHWQNLSSDKSETEQEEEAESSTSEEVEPETSMVYQSEPIRLLELIILDVGF